MNKKQHHLGIIGLSLIISLVSYQYYLVLAAPQVPFMDTMLFFVQLDKFNSGDISLLRMYGAGEHRGLIYPAITAIEWLLWGVDARISTVLTGFVVAAIFFYWLKALLLSQRDATANADQQLRLVLLISCLSALIIASPAGFELWTLSLGFAQLLKNLLIVMFLYHLAVKQRWNKSVLSALLYGACGGFLILFATYGWSYPFLAAVFFALFAISLHNREHRKNAAIVFCLMFAAQIIYIYSGSGIFANSSSASANHFSIANLINGFFYGAGTAFISGESIVKWGVPLIVPISLGAALLITCFFAVLLTLVQQSPAKVFLCSLLIFALAVLAGVTIARGGIEFTNTGASRYFVDYVWLLLAPLAIIFTTPSTLLLNNQHYIAVIKFLRLLKIIMAVLLVGALLGHSITWAVEYKMAPYRAATFEAMANVYHTGVQNEEDAQLLQSPYSVAKRAIEVAQQHNLAVLRSDAPRCTLKNALYSGAWYSPEGNDARWMGKQGAIVLSKCTGIITIKGYLPENFSQRSLDISYGNQRELITIVPGKEFSFRLDQMETKWTRVSMQLDQITSPLQAGIGVDQRELGILLTYIGE